MGSYEIERKWLVDITEPLSEKDFCIKKIRQIYFDTGIEDVELRVRSTIFRYTSSHVKTIKVGTGAIRQEFEQEISEEDFDSEYAIFKEKDMIIGEICKTRYILKEDNNITIDVYDGPLAGLVVMEKEYISADDMMSDPPVIDGVDIIQELTNNARYSNFELAKYYSKK